MQSFLTERWFQAMHSFLSDEIYLGFMDPDYNLKRKIGQNCTVVIPQHSGTGCCGDFNG